MHNTYTQEDRIFKKAARRLRGRSTLLFDGERQLISQIRHQMPDYAEKLSADFVQQKDHFTKYIWRFRNILQNGGKEDERQDVFGKLRTQQQVLEQK